MHIRELDLNDYNKGFFELMSQLTNANKPSYEDFEKSFNIIKNQNSIIIVIENEENKIIGSGKLVIEKKFHNNLRNVGHIEDIVVDENFRKHGLGKKIIDYLTAYGIGKDCYKMCLDCNDANVGFYQNCGYNVKEKHLALYNR
jgi:glucosamine-phosphate N-acetyltransferase